jgi:hypothetical protein
VTRPILYLSGPYSPGNGRTIAENIAVARSYAVAAARKGWMPLTPHLNTAHFEEDCPEVPNEGWIDGDLAILRLLPRARAAVLMLPGWEQSKGARRERQLALVRGLEVFDPPASPECIPLAVVFFACPFYREGRVGDTCMVNGPECPPGADCPIRRRCR